MPVASTRCITAGFSSSLHSMRTAGPFLSTGYGVLAMLIATALLVAVLAPFRTEVGLLNAGFIFLLLTLVIRRYGV